MKLFYLAALLTLALVSEVIAHGHIIDPMARNWIWTDPRYPNQPHNYNSQGVWCGPVETQETGPTFWVPQDQAGSQCGFCGDWIEAAQPRDHEHGGKYGRGNIAKSYQSGSVINVTVEYGAMHYGYSEYSLCTSGSESPGCFQRLTIVGGSEPIRIDNRICNGHDGTQTRRVMAQLQLPAGVRCSRCTLRWTYRTAYPWFDGWSECSVDPRPAQMFQNCADISIV